MQKKIVCFPHAVLCLLCMVMLWGGACHKSADQIPAFPSVDSVDGSRLLVEKSMAYLRADKKSLQYLTDQQPRWGNLDWSRAMPAKNPTELICLVPYLTGGDIGALAIVSISDSVKIKIVPASELSPSTAEGPQADIGLLLLHYARFKWFGKQPARSSAITFRRMEGNNQPPRNGRAVAYVMAICYDVVICTGDGYGHCIGNYRHYTECFSSTYWLHEFDYAGGNTGGWNPDLDGGYGGGGGSGGSTGGEETYLMPPTDSIPDITRYLDCFDAGQPGRLLIYVDQPQSGSDEPFTILGRMGHVFFGLEQTLPAGVVRRAVGFHPASKVNPFGKKSAGSMLASDQNRPYDLYLPIELSAAQMAQVLDATRYYATVYDLENYNCTHFVIDVALAAGVVLPGSRGWWVFGSGANPGRFGQDLRAVPGTVTRSGRAAANTGWCD